MRLLRDEEELAARMTPCEHRRGVAACHKTQALHTLHLTRLSPPPRHAQRGPRQAAAGTRVMVLRPHTPRHQRSYKARAERLHGGDAWCSGQVVRKGENSRQYMERRPPPRRPCPHLTVYDENISVLLYTMFYTVTRDVVCIGCPKAVKIDPRDNSRLSAHFYIS